METAIKNQLKELLGIAAAYTDLITVSLLAIGIASAATIATLIAWAALKFQSETHHRSI